MGKIVVVVGRLLRVPTRTVAFGAVVEAFAALRVALTSAVARLAGLVRRFVRRTLSVVVVGVGPGFAVPVDPRGAGDRAVSPSAGVASPSGAGGAGRASLSTSRRADGARRQSRDGGASSPSGGGSGAGAATGGDAGGGSDRSEGRGGSPPRRDRRARTPDGDSGAAASPSGALGGSSRGSPAPRRTPRDGGAVGGSGGAALPSVAAAAALGRDGRREGGSRPTSRRGSPARSPAGGSGSAAAPRGAPGGAAAGSLGSEGAPLDGGAAGRPEEPASPRGAAGGASRGSHGRGRSPRDGGSSPVPAGAAGAGPAAGAAVAGGVRRPDGEPAPTPDRVNPAGSPAVESRAAAVEPPSGVSGDAARGGQESRRPLGDDGASAVAAGAATVAGPAASGAAGGDVRRDGGAGEVPGPVVDRDAGRSAGDDGAGDGRRGGGPGVGAAPGVPPTGSACGPGASRPSSPPRPPLLPPLLPRRPFSRRLQLRLRWPHRPPPHLLGARSRGHQLVGVLRVARRCCCRAATAKVFAGWRRGLQQYRWGWWWWWQPNGRWRLCDVWILASFAARLPHLVYGRGARAGSRGSRGVESPPAAQGRPMRGTGRGGDLGAGAEEGAPATGRQGGPADAGTSAADVPPAPGADAVNVGGADRGGASSSRAGDAQQRVSRVFPIPAKEAYSDLMSSSPEKDDDGPGSAAARTEAGAGNAGGDSPAAAVPPPPPPVADSAAVGGAQGGGGAAVVVTPGGEGPAPPRPPADVPPSRLASGLAQVALYDRLNVRAAVDPAAPSRGAPLEEIVALAAVPPGPAEQRPRYASPSPSSSAPSGSARSGSADAEEAEKHTSKDAAAAAGEASGGGQGGGGSRHEDAPADDEDDTAANRPAASGDARRDKDAEDDDDDEEQPERRRRRSSSERRERRAPPPRLSLSDGYVTKQKLVALDKVRLLDRTVRMTQPSVVQNYLKVFRDSSYQWASGSIRVTRDWRKPTDKEAYVLVDGSHRFGGLLELRKERHANSNDREYFAVVVSRRDHRFLTGSEVLALGYAANDILVPTKPMTQADHLQWAMSFVYTRDQEVPADQRLRHGVTKIVDLVAYAKSRGVVVTNQSGKALGDDSLRRALNLGLLALHQPSSVAYIAHCLSQWPTRRPLARRCSTR